MRQRLQGHFRRNGCARSTAGHQLRIGRADLSLRHPPVEAPTDAAPVLSRLPSGETRLDKQVALTGGIVIAYLIDYAFCGVRGAA